MNPQKIKAIVAFIRAAYTALPTWAKSLIVMVEASVIGFLMQWAANPGPITTWRQFIGAVLAAIASGFRNWLKTSPIEKTQ